jgi:hypothetical protein
VTARIERAIVGALRLQFRNGGHRHHSQCIHNLPTVEWWTTVVGPLPKQITPDEWEIDPPNRLGPAAA